MTQYLSIDPLQEPTDLGHDDAGRARCGFNVQTLKRPGGSFLRELMTLLVDAGVGVENVTLFASSSSLIPDPSVKSGSVMMITATGGPAPVGTHNDGAGAYRRPTAQIIAHGPTWASAEAMAQAAFSALISVRNLAVGA